jgi:hypothetical protein
MQAQDDTRISTQQVSRWRKALKDANAYFDKIVPRPVKAGLCVLLRGSGA